MKAQVIKIGNSRGIRIPKPLLEQSGITDKIELEAKKNRIVIRPVLNLREGWNNAFKMMAKNCEDNLIFDTENISHLWDEEEWEWK